MNLREKIYPFSSNFDNKSYQFFFNEKRTFAYMLNECGHKRGLETQQIRGNMPVVCLILTHEVLAAFLDPPPPLYRQNWTKMDVNIPLLQMVPLRRGSWDSRANKASTFLIIRTQISHELPPTPTRGGGGGGGGGGGYSNTSPESTLKKCPHKTGVTT